jgi:hypothetical protein
MVPQFHFRNSLVMSGLLLKMKLFLDHPFTRSGVVDHLIIVRLLSIAFCRFEIAYSMHGLDSMPPERTARWATILVRRVQLDVGIREFEGNPLSSDKGAERHALLSLARTSDPQ